MNRAPITVARYQFGVVIGATDAWGSESLGTDSLVFVRFSPTRARGKTNCAKNYCSAQQRKSIADRIEIRAAPRDFSVADRVRARTSHAQLALISSLFSVIEKIESRSHYLRAHARAMRVLVPNFCAVNVARKREYTFPYAKSLIFSSLCSNPNAVPVDSRPH
ncbi:MAG TPA: hypothetical protein VG271_13340 [Beijerinckiaceae bacterium]|nr:hypothetical protein [Beijerinckiaceae bacterium]